MTTPEQLRRYALAEARTIFHPVGTRRMGTSQDASSVVDEAGRVHEIEHVRVIMPTIPAANTNLPTVMVAERCAALTM